MNLDTVSRLVDEVTDAQIRCAAETNRLLPVGSIVRFNYEGTSLTGTIITGAHRKSPQAVTVKLPGGRVISFGVLGVNLSVLETKRSLDALRAIAAEKPPTEGADP